MTIFKIGLNAVIDNMLSNAKKETTNPKVMVKAIKNTPQGDLLNHYENKLKNGDNYNKILYDDYMHSTKKPKGKRCK